MKAKEILLMKQLIKKTLSYIPTPLPIGMTEFDTWANSILDLSGRFADDDSLKFALASMIIHLGPQRSAVPKNYFVRSLKKGAANQVASQIFQDIKSKQQAALEAAKAAEVTAATTEVVALEKATN